MYYVLITRNEDNTYYIDTKGYFVKDIEQAALYTEKTIPDISKIIGLYGKNPEIDAIKESFLEKLTRP